MANLSDYYSLENSILSFTREQGSLFAKQVAGDFNPIHNIDHKRFCVPGDLLFTVFLMEYGLHKNMCFNFSGMVNDTSRLNFVASEAAQLDIEDVSGKKYLSVQRDGEYTHNQTVIQNIACHYVQFSGHTFPHILVPLMSEKNVMINPDRPLVIYEKMSINLDRLDIENISLEMTDSVLEANGKRGKVGLEFCFKADDKIVGHGKKSMLLSGLREYDAEKMQIVIDDYVALQSVVSP